MRTPTNVEICVRDGENKYFGFECDQPGQKSKTFTQKHNDVPMVRLPIILPLRIRSEFLARHMSFCALPAGQAAEQRVSERTVRLSVCLHGVAPDEGQCRIWVSGPRPNKGRTSEGWELTTVTPALFESIFQPDSFGLCRSLGFATLSLVHT